ncbi:MAG: aminotransferase class I/II-fold pyridoxal phosphate-dependent enzyme [Bacteroidota bacterium]
MSETQAFIPFARHHITPEDQQAVQEALKSSYLTRGPERDAFELELCDYTGADYAVSVSSGTAALHLCYMAMNVGAGDQLWTTPLTFTGTVNPAVLMGAEVSFVDVETSHWQLDVDQLKERLEKSEEEVPKIVVPVSLGGTPYDLHRLTQLKEQYEFKIVVDQCHALGGKYDGQKVGNARWAEAEIVSFHALKHLTTGEGGAILTNDKALYERLLLLRNNGIRSSTDDPWYDVEASGLNYQMTDFQAALGRSQLKRLDQHVERRRSLSRRYATLLTELGSDAVELWIAGTEAGHAAHLLVVGVPQRDQVHRLMKQRGVRTNFHYRPLHQHAAFRGAVQNHSYPNSDHYGLRALSLPLYPDLKEPDVRRVVETLGQVLNQLD